MSALLVPVMETVGHVLLHSLWQGAAVAALVALALPFLSAPTARYRLACLGLALLLALPAFTAVRFALSGHSSAATVLVPTAPAAPRGEPTIAAPSVPTTAAPRPDHAATAATPTPAPGLAASVAKQLPRALALLWLGGVLVGLTRLALGLSLVARLRRTAVAGDPRATRLALEIARRLGLRARVAVLECNRLASPVVIGVLRPALLLPAGLAANLPLAQLEAVLAHELAHVLRRDYLVNLLQRLAETLLFHHPATWWLSSVVREERENLCDDAAVRAVGGDPRPLVEGLAALAARRGAAPLVSVGASDGDLLQRAKRLLGHGARQPAPSSVLVLRAARPALLLGLLALLGPFAARSVAGAQAAEPAAPTLQALPFELRYGTFLGRQADGQPELWLHVELQPGLAASLAPATVRVLDASGATLAQVDMPNSSGWQGGLAVDLERVAAVEVTTASGAWEVPTRVGPPPAGFGPAASARVVSDASASLLKWEAVAGAAAYGVALVPTIYGRGELLTTTEPLLALDGLAPGSYEVRIWAYSRDPGALGSLLTADVAEARLGTVQVPRHEPDAAARGAVEGVVRVGSQPAPGVAVQLYPSGDGPSPRPATRTAVTDDEGRYRFEGVAPGRYSVSSTLRPPAEFGVPARVPATSFRVAADRTTRPGDLHVLVPITPLGPLASGTTTAGAVELAWEPVAGAAGYLVRVVERADRERPWASGEPLHASQLLATPRWDVSLEPARVYEVMVEAVDTDGLRIGERRATLRTVPER